MVANNNNPLKKICFRGLKNYIHAISRREGKPLNKTETLRPLPENALFSRLNNRFYYYYYSRGIAHCLRRLLEQIILDHGQDFLEAEVDDCLPPLGDGGEGIREGLLRNGGGRRVRVHLAQEPDRGQGLQLRGQITTHLRHD